MQIIQLITFIIWLIISFSLAWFLWNKYPSFKKFRSIFGLLALSLLFIILHNLVYGLVVTFVDPTLSDEPIFFILTFITFGAAVFLLMIQIVTRLKKRI